MRASHTEPISASSPSGQQAVIGSSLRPAYSLTDRWFDPSTNKKKRGSKLNAPSSVNRLALQLDRLGVLVRI
uniref:Uncharacterized protein n=1 Tax=Peronospora matthiolae TaxID=2874970 RepID=A0AAV1U0S0_9STRA